MQVLFQFLFLLFFMSSIFCSQPVSPKTQIVVRSAASDHARSIAIAQDFISQAQIQEIQNIIHHSRSAIFQNNNNLQELRVNRENVRNNVRRIAYNIDYLKKQRSGDSMFNAAQQQINDLRSQPGIYQWKYFENYKHQMQEKIEVAQRRADHAAMCGFKESYDSTKEELNKKLTSPQKLFDYFEGKLALDKIACQKKIGQDLCWHDYWRKILCAPIHALLQENKALQNLRNQEKMLLADNVEYQKILDNMHGLLQGFKLQQEAYKLNMRKSVIADVAKTFVDNIFAQGVLHEKDRLVTIKRDDIKKSAIAAVAKNLVDNICMQGVLHEKDRLVAIKREQARQQFKSAQIKVEAQLQEKKQQELKKLKEKAEEMQAKFVIEQEKKLQEQIAQEEKEKVERLKLEEKQFDVEGARAEERAKKEREQQAQMLIAAQKARDEILQAAERDRLLKIEQQDQEFKVQRVAVIKQLKFEQEQKRAVINKEEKRQAKIQADALAFQRKQEEIEKKKQEATQAENKRLKAIEDKKKEADAKLQQEHDKAAILVEIEKEKKRIAMLETAIALQDQKNAAEAHEIEEALNALVSKKSGGQLNICNLSVVQFGGPVEASDREGKTGESKLSQSATMQNMFNFVQQNLRNGTPYEKFCLKIGQQVVARTKYEEQLNNNKKLTSAARKRLLDDYEESDLRYSIKLVLQKYAKIIKDKTFIHDNALSDLAELRDRIINYHKDCLSKGEGETISFYKKLEEELDPEISTIDPRYQELHAEHQNQTVENISNFQRVSVGQHENARFHLTVFEETFKNLKHTFQNLKNQIETDAVQNLENQTKMDAVQTKMDAVQTEMRDCLKLIVLQKKEVEAYKKNVEKYSLMYKELRLYHEMKILHGMGGILDTSVLSSSENLKILEERVLLPEELDKKYKIIENQIEAFAKNLLEHGIVDGNASIIVPAIHAATTPRLTHLLTEIGLTDKSANEWAGRILNSAQVFASGYANDQVDLDTLHYHLCKKNMVGNVQDKTAYSQAQMNDVAKIQMHFVRYFARFFHDKI